MRSLRREPPALAPTKPRDEKTEARSLDAASNPKANQTAAGVPVRGRAPSGLLPARIDRQTRPETTPPAARGPPLAGWTHSHEPAIVDFASAASCGSAPRIPYEPPHPSAAGHPAGPSGSPKRSGLSEAR